MTAKDRSGTMLHHALGKKFQYFSMIFLFVHSRLRWLYDILFSLELRRQVKSPLTTVETEFNFGQIFIDIEHV